jgi:hypothetical protein
MWVELLKIFISWPFVIFVLGLAFGIGFRIEIAQFLRNIAAIKLPGGAEILTSQLPPPKSEKSEEPSPPEPAPGIITLNEDQQNIIRQHIEALTKEAADARQEKEKLLEAATNLLSEKDIEKKYWWFMYLTLFMVPTTQNVLRWFAAQSLPSTKEYYNEMWKPVVAAAEQREVILMVLLHHGLLESKGHVLQITQNGRDFLNFIGAGGGQK